MRAALVRELGELTGVTVGEIDPPAVGPGQVIIDVAACAVNFPDVLMVRGMYQEATVAVLPGPGGRRRRQRDR